MIVDQLITPMPSSFSIFLGLVAVLFFWRFKSPGKALTNFPLLREGGTDQARKSEYTIKGRHLYREGYEKFKDSIYRMVTTDYVTLVLPMKYFEELRRLPEDELSIDPTREVTFQPYFTGLTTNLDRLHRALVADLNPKLAHIVPGIADEAKRAVESELPSCEDWTPLTLGAPMMKVVAIVLGRMFFGPDLCRRDGYMDAFLYFGQDVVETIKVVKRWRWGFQWIGTRLFCPSLGRIKKHQQRIQDFISPALEERRKMIKHGEPLPEDMLSWFLKTEDTYGKLTDEVARNGLLQLSIASVHSTNNTLLNIIFDMVSCPDLIPALRKEIRETLTEHGGVLTPQSLYDMKLLDSTIRESQRMNPLIFSGFRRGVLKNPGITLKDGTFIPKDTKVEIPIDPILRDPELYPDPDKFDPYRFFRLRQSKEQIHRQQFVTVSQSNPVFGWGRHACPGRFFSANQLKLVLINLLLQYDIKMSDEQAKEGRFRNFEVQNMNAPDSRNTLLLRRIPS